MRVYLRALQQMERPSPHAQVPVYCLVRVVGESLVTVINLPNSGRGWAAKWAASPSETFFKRTHGHLSRKSY